MALIPQSDETLLHIYRCSNCGIRFRKQVAPLVLFCLVQHSPGSCCHYMESEVTDEQLEAVLKVMEGK